VLNLLLKLLLGGLILYLIKQADALTKNTRAYTINTHKSIAIGFIHKIDGSLRESLSPRGLMLDGIAINVVFQ